METWLDRWAPQARSLAPASQNGICFFCAVTPPALGGNGCEIGCDATRLFPFREKCNRIGHIVDWRGGRRFRLLIPNNRVHPRWRCLIFISSRRLKGGEGRAGAMSGDLCSGSKPRRGGIADGGWRLGRSAGEGWG